MEYHSQSLTHALEYKFSTFNGNHTLLHGRHAQDSQRL